MFNCSKYSEVLVYDWSDGGDVELIIDDIEKLDFNNLRADEKFLIWQLNRFQLTKLRER